MGLVKLVLAQARLTFSGSELATVLKLLAPLIDKIINTHLTVPQLNRFSTWNSARIILGEMSWEHYTVAGNFSCIL